MFTVKQSVIYDWSPNLFMCLSIVITKIDWKVFQWSRASSFTNFMDPPTPMLVCYHVSQTPISSLISNFLGLEPMKHVDVFLNNRWNKTK